MTTQFSFANVVNQVATTINQAGVTSGSPADGANLQVTDTTNIAAKGYALCGAELIYYDAVIDGSHVRIGTAGRGALGTTAASHASGDAIYFDPIVNAHVNELQNFADQFAFNVMSFGAKGCGTTDDTEAILAAIAAMPGGATLYFPPCTNGYLVSGAGSEIFLIDKPMNILFGGPYAAIRVASSVGPTTDVFHYAIAGEFPPPRIEGGYIFPQSGTPARHAFNFDVDATGRVIRGLGIRGLHVEALGSSAIFLTGSATNTGFFGNVIENCVLSGGIDLTGYAGDSIRILNNIITGSGIGINLMNLTGALECLIEGNNITNAGGAIVIDTPASNGFCGLVQIIRNQMEQIPAYTGGETAIIALKGSSGRPLREVNIIGNNLDPQGHLASCIKVDWAINATIRDNIMELGTSDHINITANAIRTVIGHNHYASGYATVAPTITDAGVGTIGTEKAPALVNSWANTGAGYAVAGFWKDEANTVHLKGTIASGTGTICTLPVGFRPATIQRFSVESNNGAGYIMGVVQISSTGDVNMLAGNNVDLCLDGISFLAALP